MKFVVIGAGAMGSVIAAHLAQSGEDVTLVARGSRVKQIAADGISVRGLTEFNVPVSVTEHPEELGGADVLILTVKTFDTASALQTAKHMNVGVALSPQNGVLKNHSLSEVFGREHTLGCTASLAADLQEDGSILLTVNSGIYLGELPSGISPRVESLVETLMASGVNSIASDDVRAMEWAKYVLWMSASATAVLTRLHSHALLQHEHLAPLFVDLIREGCRLAESEGVSHVEDMGATPVGSLSRMPIAEAVATVRRFGAGFEERGVTNHRMSALQDVERGRRLEIDETFGYALKTAQDNGVELPRLATCYQLLAGVNSGR